MTAGGAGDGAFAVAADSDADADCEHVRSVVRHGAEPAVMDKTGGARSTSKSFAFKAP